MDKVKEICNKVEFFKLLKWKHVGTTINRGIMLTMYLWDKTQWDSYLGNIHPNSWLLVHDR